MKPSGPRSYLQIVENRRDGKRTVHRVLATLGRVDELQASGEVDTLPQSLARFPTRVRLLREHEAGKLQAQSVRTVGPALVFEHLWKTIGIGEVLKGLLAAHGFEFPVERAVFLTVLHRLCESGSDRPAERCRWRH